MSENMSLFDLVNISIGTPEPGAVNFSALHTLLHAMLEHLHIQNVNAVWKDSDDGRDHREPLLATVGPQNPYRRMEDKLRYMERQLAELERLPSASELLSRSASVSDLWQLLQLRRRVESSEDGVSKCMALIQDLLKEIQELKESRDSLKKELEALQNQFNQVDVDHLADRITAVEQCFHQVEDMTSAMKELKEKVLLYPQREDLVQCVTWEALVSERKRMKKELKKSITGTGPPGAPFDDGIPLTQRDSPSAGLLVLGKSSSTTGPPVGTSQILPVQNGSLDSLSLLANHPLSWVSSGADRYPETVEALRDMGCLSEKHKSLEARVERLEGVKADQAQVQQLGELLSNIGQRDMPENVLEQVDHLKTLVDTIMTDKNKESEMKHLNSSTSNASKSSDFGEEESQSAGSQGKDSFMTQELQNSQTVYFRNSVQKLDEDIQKLKRDVAAINMAQNSSASNQKQDQTSELMSDVQGAILQLQAESEKLQTEAKYLMEDHRQKQSHIDHLYKTLEELNEKKADREVVEMEIGIKADKRALETKVSRIQFDNMTEQLNGMFQELLSKITGQEQDWQKVIDKISTEMECKLNRIELDPLKKQLEDRWKSIRKQLQAQPTPELDDAAGFRKQLVAKFHCISCDRPIDMITPGPHLLTVPSAPGLPSHKSNRPYTVYELEQVRHHSRSLKPGINQCYNKMSHAERSMAHRRHLSSIKCKQVDIEQGKLDWRWTPESPCRQGLREISQTHYPPILTPLERSSHNLTKHERIPEMADYGYLAISRSCGGSHTLTHTNRRYTRLQHITDVLDDGISMSGSGLRSQPEEVDILGQDGHIYKGRLNTRGLKTVESRLPTISSKEGNYKSKDRVSRCQSQKNSRAEPGHASPLRSHSAKTHASHSASSSSVKEWPVSSSDCLSQPGVPQSSADPDSELLQGLQPITE